MSADPTLFDVTRTIAATCPICHATRQPAEDRAPACTVDRDHAAGTHTRRPAGCLNAYDPHTAPLPEGY
jgi:hypothetical protein